MTLPRLDEEPAGVEAWEESPDSLNCLMIQAARGHRTLMAGLLAELDLYPGQERTLTLLWEYGPQPQNVLARLIGIDMSTMTKTLQRLERSGFVSRAPSPANRRVSIVSSTPKGDALRPEVERVLAEVHRRMIGGLSPEQAGELTLLLKVVRNNLCGEEACDTSPCLPGDTMC
ncbi:MarR family winged helix-turn-helix transcriptional regulator [Streptosporangium sp. NPDC049376]|uniref:MarR family winged helix-turn-helix transcriptional regulator n=1 Tax=Streptosporangium sp. NPDC049376 TaxID=3366192 RepID=UPI003795666C